MAVPIERAGFPSGAPPALPFLRLFTLSLKAVELAEQA